MPLEAGCQESLGRTSLLATRAISPGQLAPRLYDRLIEVLRCRHYNLLCPRICAIHDQSWASRTMSSFSPRFVPDSGLAAANRVR
jgi:hypothetical protein